MRAAGAPCPPAYTISDPCRRRCVQIRVCTVTDAYAQNTGGLRAAWLEKKRTVPSVHVEIVPTLSAFTVEMKASAEACSEAANVFESSCGVVRDPEVGPGR